MPNIYLAIVAMIAIIGITIVAIKYRLKKKKEKVVETETTAETGSTKVKVKTTVERKANDGLVWRWMFVILFIFCLWVAYRLFFVTPAATQDDTHQKAAFTSTVANTTATWTDMTYVMEVTDKGTDIDLNPYYPCYIYWATEPVGGNELYVKDDYCDWQESGKQATKLLQLSEHTKHFWVKAPKGKKVKVRIWIKHDRWNTN